MEQLNFDIGVNADEGELLGEDTVTKTHDAPLAARLRPRDINEYVGQTHLLAPGKLLRRAIDADRFTSIILHGPPGVGKTSLAELIAKRTDSAFIRLSGVTSTVADIRREIAQAVVRRQSSGRRSILFIDEIHRFNRAQQDSLLPDVESGKIRLIGATTHNPHFYVIGPLLSRSLLFQLLPLSEEEIRGLILRAIADERSFPGIRVELSGDALSFLAKICEGDARKTLNALEIAVLTSMPGADGVTRIDLAVAEASIQKKAIIYGDDGHYDTASAFIKSMRGSDPDAAVYWLAKMLHAGEDIRFIARRIVIFASEDIGNADPRALSLATSAMQAIEMIGMPEARIILSQAVTYCATAPKSNASYMAVDAALGDVSSERVQAVPMHLRDSSYSGAKKMGHGEGYKYPHGFDGNFVAQDYMGVWKSYYQPGESGYEAKIKERMAYWAQCRGDGEGKDSMIACTKDKKTLRAEFVARRSELTEDFKADASLKICGFLLGMNSLVNAKIIAAYVSDGSEPDLSILMGTLGKKGAQFCFPRYNAERRAYEMALALDPDNDLVKGRYGILEPSPQMRALSREELSLIPWLIPGVAFDQRGTRLGRGAGVYDKLLERVSGLKIGVLFETQKCAELPAEAHDCRMDRLVSETGVQHCAQKTQTEYN